MPWTRLPQLVCPFPTIVYHTLINFIPHFSSFRGHSKESLSNHLSARNKAVLCHVWFVRSNLEPSLVLIPSPALALLLPRICNAIYVICTSYSIIRIRSLSGIMTNDGHRLYRLYHSVLQPMPVIPSNPHTLCVFCNL